MAVTYEWKILSLRRDSAGTVTEVYWSKTGTDQDGRTAMFSMVDNLDNGDPSSPSYIDFSSLTEEDVIAWVQSRVTGVRAMDVDHYIQRRLLEQSQSVEGVEASMPWAPEEVPPDMQEGE